MALFLAFDLYKFNLLNFLSFIPYLNYIGGYSLKVKQLFVA